MRLDGHTPPRRRGNRVELSLILAGRHVLVTVADNKARALARDLLTNTEQDDA